MPRKDEIETDKVISVVKDFSDSSLYVGFYSIIYVEKNFLNENIEYFYDASDNKLYVRDYKQYIDRKEMEIR